MDSGCRPPWFMSSQPKKRGGPGTVPLATSARGKGHVSLHHRKMLVSPQCWTAGAVSASVTTGPVALDKLCSLCGPLIFKRGARTGLHHSFQLLYPLIQRKHCLGYQVMIDLTTDLGHGTNMMYFLFHFHVE